MKKVQQLLVCCLFLMAAKTASAQLTWTVNGQQIATELEEQWILVNGNYTWVNEYQSLWSYANGNTTTVVSKNWTNGAWVNSYGYTFGYTNNILTLVQEKRWKNNAWRDYQRSTATYLNNDPNKFLSIISDTLGSTGYLPYTRTTYTYDANQVLVQRYAELYTASGWVSLSLYTYTNDGLGRPLTFTITDAYNGSGILQNGSRYSYTYNGAGQVAIETEEWGSTQSATGWANARRRTYSYNAGNKATTKTQQLWDNNAWKNDERTLNTYNAANFLTNTQTDGWDGTTFITPYTATDYTLNSNNNATNELYRARNFSANLVFMNSSRTTRTFNTTVATQNVAAAAPTLHLYPNPTSDRVTIDLPEGTQTAMALITNAAGQTVALEPLSANNSSLYVQQLPAGVYTVSLMLQGNMMTTRFIKK